MRLDLEDTDDSNSSVLCAKTNCEIKIDSPFKCKHSNIQSKKKVQQKLTKMFVQNSKEPGFTMQAEENCRIVEPKKMETVKENKVETEKEVKQNWKVKAIVDNRNFLIPIA